MGNAADIGAHWTCWPSAIFSNALVDLVHDIKLTKWTLCIFLQVVFNVLSILIGDAVLVGLKPVIDLVCQDVNLEEGLLSGQVLVDLFILEVT